MPRGTKAVDLGFEIGSSDNLPMVDGFMVANFFSSESFLSPEIRNVKALRSTRAMYTDNAIGFVQVRRTDDDDLCEVRAEITPEHRVGSPNYNMYAIIDEENDIILDAKCESCKAQNDKCKHSIAFVAWLHRRSEEPSVTSVQCYWRKSVLSTIGSSKKSSKISEYKEQNKRSVPIEKTKPCFNEACQVFKGIEKTKEILVVKHQEVKKSLSLHHLMMSFKKQVDKNEHNSQKFIGFCSSVMTDEECKKPEKQTVDQAVSSLWFSVRFARITASKLYEASRCQTPTGSLVNAILGIVKIKETDAIKRGRFLEDKVLKVVQKKYAMKLKKVGFIMKKEYPIFGASPDGVIGDYIIEVKCPISEKTFKTYFDKTGEAPSSKCKGQMALQMFMSDKTKGLFCVADPEFEKNQKVKILEVTQDEDFINSVMGEALQFWSECVYPILHDDKQSLIQGVQDENNPPN